MDFIWRRRRDDPDAHARRLSTPADAAQPEKSSSFLWTRTGRDTARDSRDGSGGGIGGNDSSGGISLSSAGGSYGDGSGIASSRSFGGSSRSNGSGGSSSCRSSHVASELADVFNLMDRDGDGKISCDELATLLRTIGEADDADDEATAAAVRAMMAQADTDGDGSIDFDEFLRVNAMAAEDAAAAAAARGAVDSEAAAAEQEEELRSVFAFFDRDGDGVITAGELCSVLQRLWAPQEDVTMEECERIVKAADANSDGVLDFGEFVRVMRGSALVPPSPVGSPR
eukprot:TRINITY_DN72043_c0_g1_i1.p2 TRINITY_DN72043_c0_g1~~TRINITY_DN72043_c0_g1_i1.p2  ORF type:complete len:284 (-),score=17.36 TRINITY_DN72043_c0_g1_i1:1534-2385(-)